METDGLAEAAVAEQGETCWALVVVCYYHHHDSSFFAVLPSQNEFRSIYHVFFFQGKEMHQTPNQNETSTATNAISLAGMVDGLFDQSKLEEAFSQSQREGHPCVAAFVLCSVAQVLIP